MIAETETGLSLLSIFFFFITIQWSSLYRNIGFIVFELICCIIITVLFFTKKIEKNEPAITKVAIIFYSIIISFFGTLLTATTTFLLGANLFDLGTIILSTYIGLIIFRTCIFTGFKSLLLTIIRSPLFPNDVKIAPIYYALLSSYLCSFSNVAEIESIWFHWPNFAILGATTGRFLGTLYKLTKEVSDSNISKLD